MKGAGYNIIIPIIHMYHYFWLEDPLFQFVDGKFHILAAVIPLLVVVM